MADQTWIDTAAARRHFKVTGEVAVRLEEALRRIDAIRTTMPDPWGTDEYGARFSANNEPKAEGALRNLRDVIKHLKDLMDHGITQVDRFEDLDRSNASAVRRKS
jgi:hypothetical protein